MPERARSKRSSLQKQIKKKNSYEEAKKKSAAHYTHQQKKNVLTQCYS